jgi:DNA helicase IV
LEDERLEAGEEDRTGRLLAAEIERPRVGPMRDIVATIQPEQDDLVRAGLAESICVQGAPGTGKTAVGLHRAAYLLYAHRERLRRGGVLVLGPNRAFLGYISAVLPTLGEVDVEQTTLEQLLATVPVRAQDSPAAAAVKHDPRMALVLREALYARIRKPAEPVVVADGPARWRIREDVLRRLVDDTRREALPYTTGRERVRARLVELVRRQAEERGRTASAAWTRMVRRAVTPFLDAVWPAVRPEEVLTEVLSGRTPAGALTPDERRAITWARPPRGYRSARWSAADLVLLDELAGLLERPRGYGHVIVDEAQDLSPMQCRAVARRSEHGSITVLGDLAQGTAPWAARSWPPHLELLGKPNGRLVALTEGFRVPAEVTELADRLLPALEVDVPVTRSRRAGGRVRLIGVPELLPGVVEAARQALEFEGSVGVIAADDQAGTLTAALWDGGLDVAGRLGVLPASLAKGLEYDHVVVCEPAAIVEAEERGLHRLYVALTRAVSRLDVVHARPLPPQLSREPRR